MENLYSNDYVNTVNAWPPGSERSIPLSRCKAMLLGHAKKNVPNKTNWNPAPPMLGCSMLGGVAL